MPFGLQPPSDTARFALHGPCISHTIRVQLYRIPGIFTKFKGVVSDIPFFLRPAEYPGMDTYLINKINKESEKTYGATEKSL